MLSSRGSSWPRDQIMSHIFCTGNRVLYHERHLESHVILILWVCTNVKWMTCSVQFSHSVVSDSLPPHGLQHARLTYPAPTPEYCSNSCPSSRWCHPTISSFIVPFSSCLQSFWASGSFPVSQFFTSGGQNIGASASASVLPMNVQDWFPLRLTGFVSLLSKGLSRNFSNTTVQKHQFFSAEFSLWSNSHIHPYMTTGKTIALTIWTFVG